MIAKSDLVILTLSTAALAVGIVRWQHGTTVVPSVTVPASARVADAPASPAARAPETASLPAARTEGGAVAAAPAPGPEAAEPVVERLPATDAGARAAPAIEAPAVVRLPAGDTVDDVTVDPAALVEAPDTPRYGEYLVRSGDYLGLIAQRHGTTVDALREINDIRGSTIRVGQRIRYPLPGD